MDDIKIFLKNEKKTRKAKMKKWMKKHPPQKKIGDPDTSNKNIE